ncbi:MAG: hypothetical protein QM796_14460 [Chthoniobacteraceae bacterium]
MGELGWLVTNWTAILQTTSIVAGFFGTAISIRQNTQERKISNLFALTSAHREIWSQLYERKELLRVLAPSVDLRREPTTVEEEMFVHTLILHLRTAFKARTLGMQFDDDAVAADIRQFFSRSIPSDVWQRSKVFQDADFVNFVEGCLKMPGRKNRDV